MRRILTTDVLALVGLLLIGAAVFLAWGVAATAMRGETDAVPERAADAEAGESIVDG